MRTLSNLEERELRIEALAREILLIEIGLGAFVDVTVRCAFDRAQAFDDEARRRMKLATEASRTGQPIQP